jgi:hypothetical protein
VTTPTNHVQTALAALRTTQTKTLDLSVFNPLRDIHPDDRAAFVELVRTCRSFAEYFKDIT